VLGQVLRRVAPAAVSPDLLAGFEHFDDAGAVRLGPGRVGLYTVDFFPPVVDDPRGYGAIAAANSLSDVYACGGEPKVVLNLAGIPEDWDDEILGPLFDGAVAKVMESGALWVGGHSVRATEPMFGFAVFGEVAEHERIGHDRAQAGDRLFLTKPIGAGSITTGIKKGKTAEGDARDAMDLMARLNRVSARAARAAGAKCATDVTGFGLLGHGLEMARGSNVTLVVDWNALPLLCDAATLTQQGCVTGASHRNWASYAESVVLPPGLADWQRHVMTDPQTSGGLLVSCAPDRANAIRETLVSDGYPFARIVGRIEPGPAIVRIEA
jgi:selenide,water dikinase